jgi:O-acetyl-ADP-ribose deacetylase (regulator of RNase III)
MFQAAWSDVQKRYSTIEQEMLSIIVAVRKLHPYLFNRLTVLYTDCKSLKFIFHNTKILNDKVLRWVLTLAQYQLLVMHIAGKENVTSDYLSRMPQKNTVDTEDVMRVPLYSIEGIMEDDEMLCDRDIWGNFNITIGYIERHGADILVNATNTELSPRGGVDRALQMAGGPQLLEHCRQIGYCGEGEIVITPGYDLPCKFVAHVVGPKAHQSAKQLEQCYTKCYEALEQLNCNSICFPCISCGVFGFNAEVAARIAVKTSIAWLREHKRQIDITFLIHPRDKKNLELYEKLLRQISQPHPQTLPKRRAVPLSKMTSVPASNAALQITLQEKYDKECEEDTHPILMNFGQLHVIPPTSTLKDVIEWSSELERELVASEPINDEICAMDEVVTVEEDKDLWQIDPVQIAKDQRTDPEWKVRIDKLTNDEVPIDLPKNKIFQLLSTINDYVVQPNELLYRVWNKNQQRGKINAVMQLCLPEKHRNAVIANAHQNGHFGALKVYLRLRESYYWPSMFKDIKALIEMCKICQYANARAHKRVPLNPADVPSGPLEDVHLDILRISAPSNGMNYIVVMICAFSRLTRCVAVKHKTAESTANAFYRGWLSVYGAPLKLSIYSDCGLEFKGAVFQCLLRSYGLRSIFTNYYSPSTNGICERLNRTILSVLRRLVDNHPRDWANHLDACTNAVNSSISVSTNYSPFELIHGMKIRQPNQIIPPLMTPDTPLNEQEAIEFWKDRIDTIRSEATAIMEQAQIDQKEQYDKHTGKTQLNVGDLCAKIVERFPKEGSKMVHKYEGVFEVRRFTSVTNVELYDIEKEIMHPRYLHVNKLKKIHQGRTQPADYVGLSLKDIQPVVNDRVNRPADLADILNKSATQDSADLLEESYLQNGFYRNTNAPTRIMTRSQTQLSDLIEEPSDDEEDYPVLTVPLRQPSQREVRFDHLPLPARCLRPELVKTPGLPTMHRTLVPEGHKRIVSPARTKIRPLLEPIESYPEAVRIDDDIRSEISQYSRESARSTETSPAAIPVMENLDSGSNSVRSDSPLSSSMEAESPAETSFHEISKVLSRKTDSDGIDWMRVRWKNHPSKKYNSWVQASDIKKTFATQTSPVSSSDEEAHIGVHEESMNISVPIEVSSASEDLDETVIPSTVTRPASPIAASAKSELTPETYDPFASRSRLAQSPPLSSKPKVSTPLASPPTKRTSTPSGDVTSVNVDDWDLTRVSDITTNSGRGSLDPKEHLKRMESVLHDRSPVTPIETSPFYHSLIEFFNDLPIIQEFLQLEFTTQMQLALVGARNAISSRTENSTPWMTYAHTKHPFASFFIMGTAIESNVCEMGVSTDKRFKTLENIFQYYKARISGDLRTALACRYCPPKEARQLTSEENLIIPDVNSWDRASKGTMLISIATSIVSRPLVLELLLGSAGHHLGLLGTSKKWSCGRVETELTDKDPEFENIHGSSYEILRELYLLAHVGSFSVKPDTLHTKALIKWDSPCPTMSKAPTLLEEGKRLCQQMIWCEARIGYLLQRYNVVAEGPGILRPDAYYPHESNCFDPLKIGKEVDSSNSMWNRRVVGDFLMKMMFEGDV